MALMRVVGQAACTRQGRLGLVVAVVWLGASAVLGAIYLRSQEQASAARSAHAVEIAVVELSHGTTLKEAFDAYQDARKANEASPLVASAGGDGLKAFITAARVRADEEARLLKRYRAVADSLREHVGPAHQTALALERNAQGWLSLWTAVFFGGLLCAALATAIAWIARGRV